MKKILAFLMMMALFNITFAQNKNTLNNTLNTSVITENNLPIIRIKKDINVMFRSPEPVQFVDLSSDRLIGDLPTDNIVRLKLAKYKENDSLLDSLTLNANKEEINYFNGETIGIISIIGQSFIAQYKLVYADNNLPNNPVITNIQISEKDMQPTQYPTITMSEIEMKKYAQRIIKYGDKKNIRKNSDFKMGAKVNNIYAYDDYIFLDITFTNTTNLSYDTGNVEFSVDDKKIYKATNNQSIELTPVFQLYPNSKFKNQFRNVFVFKKFTFPNNKILNIRIYENGISGRTLSTQIKYSDVLEADTF